MKGYTMTLPASQFAKMVGKPLTPAQVGLIRSLAPDRQWDTLEAPLIVIIKKCIRWDGATVTFPAGDRATASKAIDALYQASKTIPSVTLPGGSHSTPEVKKKFGVGAQLKEIVAKLPLSKYAVTADDGHTIFVKLHETATTGNRWIYQLVGAPGGWSIQWQPVGVQLEWAQQIAADPWAAAKLYCEKYTRCCCCDSPLSNAKSIADAIGPVCKKKFGL
jgi:hypothetical protein